MPRHVRADLRSQTSLCGRKLAQTDVDAALFALNARMLSGPEADALCWRCMLMLRRVDRELEVAGI